MSSGELSTTHVVWLPKEKRMAQTLAMLKAHGHVCQNLPQEICSIMVKKGPLALALSTGTNAKKSKMFVSNDNYKLRLNSDSQQNTTSIKPKNRIKTHRHHLTRRKWMRMWTVSPPWRSAEKATCICTAKSAPLEIPEIVVLAGFVGPANPPIAANTPVTTSASILPLRYLCAV